ncbi:uncharacterized protein LOC124954165 [Vespa velutina]|uniref:uncharacterized protein LOC124954165 n=1 Tax=Vespa velutina TaxID=202808 RepID=UPI001FB34D14|nr:uncharacterized protein LOC124954165 [Vespa velutina]XP_047362629.1 uncharacterized protein LOC124954165 [Vespa velutina]
MIEIKYLSIAILISASIVDIAIADPNIEDLSKQIEDHSVQDTIINSIENSCECIRYDCGCCKRIETDIININGSVCANATYLDQEYGFSVTMTYKTIIVTNKTVSAKNPPPICYGFLYLSKLPIFTDEICLHLYDIDVSNKDFHICFEIIIKMVLGKEVVTPLGCITKKLKSPKEIYKEHPNVLMV